VLDPSNLTPREAELLARLGLCQMTLVAPVPLAESDIATPDGLLIASEPPAESDAALDLRMLALLAMQLAATLSGSRAQPQIERDLRASPPQPPALIDQLPIVALQTDRAGRCTMLNQTWATLLGLSVAESLGAYLWDYVHPDDHADAQRLFGSVIDGCAPIVRTELRMLGRAGRVCWGELTLTPLLDAGGRIAGATGVISDITERRLAAQVQADRERFFERLATDAALVDVLEPLVRMLELHYPDGSGSIMICDEAGLIQRQSPVAATPGTYAYSLASGLQGPIDGLCPLTFSADSPLIVADIAADPRWRAYQHVLRVDGRACWAQPLHDPEGALLGMLVIAYDQPRTPRAEMLAPLAEVAALAATGLAHIRDAMALRDREELFRLISENTTDHIGVLDEQGNYLYASPSLHVSLGYNPEDLIGISAFTHVHPDDLEVTIASWTKVEAHGLVQSTFRYRTTDGDWRWFDANGNAVSYRGVRAFISVSRDVTERRQAEEARQRLEAQLAQAQKMESIGTLAGGIAHDFNNILTAILGNVQLALLGLQRQSAEYPLLQEIEKAATRAATLTRQLLTFSRYQQHERKAVDLNATISDLLQMFRRLSGGSIEIVIDLAPDLPLLVADPVQIEQVMLNLAVNARDAMPQGGQLRITTRTSLLDEAACRNYPWTRPGPYVQITVSDTGVGMTPETQQRIFEPFFTTKGPGKGTGLGLAVVYGIIKQYDGFITVTSAVGQGSTFSVSLPAQTVISLPSEPLEQPHARGGVETILVVEDEASLRQLATTILERLGYTVVCAEDGLAAVDVFAADPQQFDLVILDLIMPRLGGRDALARIRAIRPDVPAFFVTGYDSSAERSAAASTLSAAPILSKPYRLDTLGLTVRQLLDS
jgi:PAS domain S-box-containing protein